jgi:ubiquinone/menaquinone biosynthesis C-methylase UbiE
MDIRSRGKLATYLKLLSRHRGEATGAYDEVTAVYDDFARVWDQQIAAPALRHINQLIEERVKPGAVVLDVGAGTGERTLALLEHSQPGKVIALDASAAMLDVARSKIHDPRVSFIQGDVHHLQFADNTFDVVVCT